MKKKLCILGFTTLFAGCTAVGPDYKRVDDHSLNEQFQETLSKRMTQSASEMKAWWKLFNDPLLSELVEDAAKCNYDVKIAMTNILQSRALLEIAGGDRLPTLSALSSVTREGTRGSFAAPNGETNWLYSAGLSASWEIDLFGRVRRNIEAVTGEYEATVEDYHDVMLAVYAQTANAYLNVRSIQAQLEATQNNILSQQQVLDLTQKRYKNGLSTDLDVAQAERVLATSEAAIPPLRSSLMNATNSIDVLIGKMPGSTRERLAKVQEVPLPTGQVTVGVPADLLRQRPDIRRAERKLAAQVARIGIATSQLYPALSLNGTFNFASTDFSDFFDRPSRAFSFGPSLSWNIFQGGKVESLIRQQDALALQQYYAYQQTVLKAVNETENAMTAYIEQLIQFEAQKRAMVSARRSFKLSTSLYKQGLIDFTRVLDSQIALLQTETSVASARGNTAINLVNLYRAMGGGWDYNQDVVLTTDPNKIKENELKPIIKSEIDNEK